MMVSIELDYNPFTVETTVVYDGTVQTPEMGLFIRRGERLQNWIDGFVQSLPDKVNDKNIKILFRGTCVDAEDVRQCVDIVCKQNKSLRIDLDTAQAVEVTPDDKLKALKKLVASARKKSPLDCFKRDKAFLERIECAMSPDFEVNVVATMSSGKSTLINALLGHNLMPAKSKATTAKTAKIKDCDNLDAFRGRFADGKGKWSKWQLATAALVAAWNEDAKVKAIELEGNIQAIDQQLNIRLVLVDTPGPNNSQNEDHRRATLDAVNSDSLSMVLYVMNAGQAAVNDDKALLEVVRDCLQAGGRQAHERFIFVVNKIDEIQLNEHYSPAENILEQRAYLRRNGIDNALMIPLCARLALLVRIQRKGLFVGEYASSYERKLRDLVEDFNGSEKFNMVELSRPALGEHTYEDFKKQLTDDGLSNEQKAELRSGVPVLEALLVRYIRKYAIPIKIKDTVDVLKRVVREAANEAETVKVLEQAEAQASKLAAELKRLNKGKGKVKMAARFKDKIESLSYERSEETIAMHEKLQAQLEEFFTTQEKKCNGQATSDIGKKTLEALKDKAIQISRKIQAEINKQYRREYVAQLEDLRCTYEAEVKDVIGKSLPDDALLGNLVKASLTIPLADEMISAAKLKKREKTGKKKYAGEFFKPTTWFKWEDEYEMNEYIDMQKAFEVFRQGMRRDLNDALEDLERSMREGFATAKETIQSNMQDVEELLKENLNEIRAASKDKKKCQSDIQQCVDKLDWNKRFQQHLQDILAVQ